MIPNCQHTLVVVSSLLSLPPPPPPLLIPLHLPRPHPPLLYLLPSCLQQHVDTYNSTSTTWWLLLTSPLLIPAKGCYSGFVGEAAEEPTRHNNRRAPSRAQHWHEPLTQFYRASAAKGLSCLRKDAGESSVHCKSAPPRLRAAICSTMLQVVHATYCNLGMCIQNWTSDQPFAAPFQRWVFHATYCNLGMCIQNWTSDQPFAHAPTGTKAAQKDNIIIA